MTPLVTVVIPAFNREQTIGTALDSALSQSLHDIEVIVVDDGSTDATGKLARKKGDLRVRVISHERNRGAAAARNSGIVAARGEFVALLDSDDAWSEAKLERQVGALRTNPRADISVCGVHMRLIDQRRAYDAIPGQSEDWLRRLLADCGLNPGATLVARRGVFETVGLMDETLTRFEDWDWLVRYAASGGAIEIVPEVLAVVNNRRGRLGWETECSARRFLAKHETLRALYGRQFSRRAETDVWMQVAGTYGFAGEWRRFACIFLQAAGSDPLYCWGRLLRAGFHWVAGAVDSMRETERLDERSLPG